jgi:hypothetical protein
MAYSQWTPNVQMKYFIFDWSIYRLLVLNYVGKHVSPNTYIRTCLLDRRVSWTKCVFWDAKNKKRRKFCKFRLSYLITHMAYLWSQRTPNVQIEYFMFDWSIYRLFVLNTTLKRDFLQMWIFVNVWSTRSMVHIKDAFWYVRNKKWIKWCKFVSAFLFNNVYRLPVFTTDAKYPNQVFYIWLVDLYTICAKYDLETLFCPIYDIRKYMLDMKHGLH